MRQMRADATLELHHEQRSELERIVRSRLTPQAVALRAGTVLITAQGLALSVIGEKLGISLPTVRKWRARYAEEGLAGLRNEPRPGRPRKLDDQRVADLFNVVCSAERSQRPSDLARSPTPSASGVPRLPAPDRQADPTRPGGAPIEPALMNLTHAAYRTGLCLE
jgi:hypothetical protein